MNTISITFPSIHTRSKAYNKPDDLINDLLRDRFEAHLDEREKIVRKAPPTDFYNL